MFLIIFIFILKSNISYNKKACPLFHRPNSKNVKWDPVKPTLFRLYPTQKPDLLLIIDAPINGIQDGKYVTSCDSFSSSHFVEKESQTWVYFQ